MKRDWSRALKLHIPKGDQWRIKSWGILKHDDRPYRVAAGPATPFQQSCRNLPKTRCTTSSAHADSERPRKSSNSSKNTARRRSPLQEMRAVTRCCICVVRMVMSVSRTPQKVYYLVLMHRSRPPEATLASASDIAIDTNQRGRNTSIALGHRECSTRMCQVVVGVAGRARRRIDVASGEHPIELARKP